MKVNTFVIRTRFPVHDPLVIYFVSFGKPKALSLSLLERREPEVSNYSVQH